MGPNPGGGEHVHNSAPKYSSKAILLQSSVEAR